ncbi:MAG: hypothetical protein RM022_026775 [Nostoc sp. EfeVER01]|uniref:hypothetical protein n=1 Tax=Nostoc sp. EfeVER01 TaxID=3075406 RepID=UPI003918CEA9
MQDKNSVYANPAVAQNDTIETQHGKQTTYATHPVGSNDNARNLPSSETTELQLFQKESSTSLKNVSVYTVEVSPPNYTSKTNSKLPATSDTQNNKEIDARDTRLQYFSLFLKFIEQQLTSQFTLLFFGTLVFILATMLIGQSYEGIKFKLDLEVSPPSSQVDRNFKDNK